MPSLTGREFIFIAIGLRCLTVRGFSFKCVLHFPGDPGAFALGDGAKGVDAAFERVSGGAEGTVFEDQPAF